MNNKDIGGWLRRRGQRIPSWSKKWFVLHEKSLFMYAKQGDGKCLDTIMLDKQEIVEPPLDPNDPKHGYFDIKNGSELISLCADSLEDKQTWLRALKRVLYADKGGALFSQSLEEILFWEKSSGRRIPYIVDECVQYLYKYGLDVEGIFRLAGRQVTIKEVIARFERGEKIEFEKEETDVHVVASVLKAFLRDLPDSLIPCEWYQKFMNIALRFIDAKENEEAQAKCVVQLITAMDLIPDDNYIILKYVCTFLNKVALQVEKNKMTMMNLGTIFGNNIIRHVDKENSQLLLCTADLGQNLVYMLLKYLTEVFIRELREDSPRNNNVATADLLLLNMPNSVDVSQKSQLDQNISDDLRGLDLSTQPQPSKDSTSIDADLITTNSKSELNRNKSGEVVEPIPKKRTLHLSLKRRVQPPTSIEITDHQSLSDSSFHPPIPPRRNRLIRNRPVSEKKRPKCVHLQSGESSPQSPRSEFQTPPETPTSPTSLSSGSDSLGLEYDIDHNSNNRRTGEYLPSYDELFEENNRMKNEIFLQKERYKKDISALRLQHASLNQKYEQRIKTMESHFESQKKDLEMKLEQEKLNVITAINSTMELKTELSQYQLKYGKLPS